MPCFLGMTVVKWENQKYGFYLKGGSRLKKRIRALLLCLMLVFFLAVPVSANNVASGVSSLTTVTTDGNCVVNMTVTLRLDTPVEGLTFPLPLNAQNIKRDGSLVRSRQTANAILVELSSLNGFVGEVVLNFTYEIKDVVALEVLTEKQIAAGQKPELMLTLPLLSGFNYPIESMKFTIILPGEVSGKPIFSSIYHQDSIESDLQYVIANNQITGNISNLKDNETLAMRMQVPIEMFTGVSTYQRTGNPEIKYMLIAAGIALLYWLIFLRTLPLTRDRRTTPPEGATAGEMASRLTLSGADLTMMVLSWAQLGYVMIHLDDNGRVMLHKRMEMGNERSNFEVKTFKSLFGNRRVIDGTGYQYARLCRKVASAVPGKKMMCKKGNGSVKIFRLLAAVSHGICGICLAMNLTVVPALQVVLSILLFILCAVSAWLIQAGMFRIHLRNKVPMWFGFALCLAWTLVGVWAGIWYIPLCSVLAQLLMGLMAAYGGRRSDTGRLNAKYILGLRRYLKNLTEEEVLRLQRNDPDFFYNMIPYAMALGIDKKFAKVFGRKKLDQCPYFVCGIRNKMNAADCNRFLHEAMEILDFRQRRMLIDNLLSTHINYR